MNPHCTACARERERRRLGFGNSSSNVQRLVAMEVTAGVPAARSTSRSLILDPIREIQPRCKTICCLHSCSKGTRVPSPIGSVTLSKRNQVESRSPKCRSSLESLESLFCYDKRIPEEAIEEPVGTTVAERQIGDNPCCIVCRTKGVVLCSTCSGSGLYIDSILESQGILVKVRCLGCGGTGNTMCAECAGRGHL